MALLAVLVGGQYSSIISCATKLNRRVFSVIFLVTTQAPGHDRMVKLSPSSYIPNLHAWLWITHLQNLKISRFIKKYFLNFQLKKKHLLAKKLKQRQDCYKKVSWLQSVNNGASKLPSLFSETSLFKVWGLWIQRQHSSEVQALSTIKCFIFFFFHFTFYCPIVCNSTHVITCKRTFSGQIHTPSL